MLSMANPMTINVETQMIDNVYSLEKEFFQLIYIYIYIYIYLNIIIYNYQLI